MSSETSEAMLSFVAAAAAVALTEGGVADATVGIERRRCCWCREFLISIEDAMEMRVWK